MQTVIAIIGIFSLALMSLGTAVALIFFGFLMAGKVFLAGLLIFGFAYMFTDFK